MKRLILFVIILSLSNSVIAQTKMIINKNNGTSDSLNLSDIKSITFKISSVQPFTHDMVSVTGGTFTAGTTPVTISSFKIDKYAVTYDLWTNVVNWGLTHGYTDLTSGQNGYNPVGSNNPVTNVNWYDVVKWCNACSEKDGFSPLYYTDSTQTTIYKTGQIDINITAVKWTANGYRLPTECEYEFAARGGNQTKGYTYSGSNNIDSVAWYFGNSGNSTHPVGQKGANELGIYDMSGNVWGRCWDWYSIYPSGGTTDPKGPSTKQTNRSIRGGSASNDGSWERVSARLDNDPNNRNGFVGFRCVKN